SLFADASVASQADAADNSAPFTPGETIETTRQLTAASVTWIGALICAFELKLPCMRAVPEFTSTAPVTTIDLSGVIQEVVNRAGWRSGTALTLVFYGALLHRSLPFAVSLSSVRTLLLYTAPPSIGNANRAFVGFFNNNGIIYYAPALAVTWL